MIDAATMRVQRCLWTGIGAASMFGLLITVLLLVVRNVREEMMTTIQHTDAAFIVDEGDYKQLKIDVRTTENSLHAVATQLSALDSSVQAQMRQLTNIERKLDMVIMDRREPVSD